VPLKKNNLVLIRWAEVLRLMDPVGKEQAFSQVGEWITKELIAPFWGNLAQLLKFKVTSCRV
jgi:hypothetical protein